jgi:PAS domain S-box-containing protein
VTETPTVDSRLLEESAEDLYEHAPCGYLSTDPRGRIVKVNQTFLDWTGYTRDELLAGRRFADLLTAGGRIYHETHYAPLLAMQGAVREIAIEIVRADGTVLPALINSTLRTDAAARPQVIRTTIFDATDRRRYEQDLLAAHRREQTIAQELQRSLLAGTLASTPGLEIGVAYQPAVVGLDVGGDWHDAFRLDDSDAVGLVVGDVVGRGIHAAATMGQLRSAVRALASTKLEPAALLEALDGFSRRHDVGTGTTLVYARLETAPPRLCWARAGHLPPVVIEPGAEPRLLWEGLSPPLDAHVEEGVPRAGAALDLSSGATIVLYTDGLVERRSEVLDDGLARLLEAIRVGRDDPVADLPHRLVTALSDPDHRDDVCVLVARVSPASR